MTHTHIQASDVLLCALLWFQYYFHSVDIVKIVIFFYPLTSLGLLHNAQYSYAIGKIMITPAHAEGNQAACTSNEFVYDKWCHSCLVGFTKHKNVGCGISIVSSSSPHLLFPPFLSLILSPSLSLPLPLPPSLPSLPAIRILRETLGGFENPNDFATLCRSSSSTLKTLLREWEA